jgi:hypothetical protein
VNGSDYNIVTYNMKLVNLSVKMRKYMKDKINVLSEISKN